MRAVAMRLGWRMNLPPQFTIVTPAFNQAQYLEQAIRSVVEQKDVRIEYFVFDGGSTDGSAAIIAKYAHVLADWSSAPDAGQTDAIVRGWGRACGAVVAWLNSDDYYVAGALALVAAEFERDNQIQVVIGACRMVDERGTVIGRKYAREFNLHTLLTTSGGVPGQPAVFVRRSLSAAVGLPDATLHYVMDWEYWLRPGLHLRPGQVRVMHAELAVVRSWPGTKTRTGVAAICREHRFVLERMFAGGMLPVELRAADRGAGWHASQAVILGVAGRAQCCRLAQLGASPQNFSCERGGQAGLRVVAATAAAVPPLLLAADAEAAVHGAQHIAARNDRRNWSCIALQLRLAHQTPIDSTTV